MSAYTDTLKAARKTPTLQQSDAQAMAAFCTDLLPHLAGAVSPELVWNGAQSKGMTTQELAKLATTDPRAVEEMMWI